MAGNTEPTLVALPVELKEHIGKYCDKKSLWSLRLAAVNSDELYPVVTDIFVDRHIKKRRHLYSSAGLELLVEITESRLGKYVEEIVLVSEKLVIQDWRKIKPSRSGDDYGYRRLASCNYEVEFLRESELGPEYLELVFRNMVLASRNIAIVLDQGGKGKDLAFGFAARRKQVKKTGVCNSIKDISSTPGNQCQEILMALMLVSANADAPVRHLDARYHSMPDEYDVSYGFDFAPRYLSTRPAWSALLSLRLDLGEDARLWSDKDWTRFTQFIDAAPQLETIALRRAPHQFYDVNEGVLTRFGGIVSKVPLKTFELGRWYVSEEELREFLCVQLRGLKAPVLVDVALPAGPDDQLNKAWHRILTMVGTNAGLIKLEFHHLSRIAFRELGGDHRLETRHTSPLVDGQGSPHFVCEEKEALQGAIASFVRGAHYLETVLDDDYSDECDGQWAYRGWKRTY